MKNILKRLHIFSKFNESELSQIESYFKLRTSEKDETIIACNDINKELFFVVDGKILSILKLPGSIQQKHQEYTTNDFFGEISLFGNKPAFKTFVSAEKSLLLTIEENKFIELKKNNSNIAIELISNLLASTIQQLRNTSKFLADVVQWGENASQRVITDELTGVYNRTFLEDAMENFFNLSKSNNKPLSLFMVDLDNFRVINDTVGHETANKIILRLVNIIKSVISKHGIIARYGGDEFTILLPEANLEKAKKIAEKIRNNVESYNFSEYIKGENISITTSIGISNFPETANDFDSFKKNADSSLYRAKKLGRNRVASIE